MILFQTPRFLSLFSTPIRFNQTKCQSPQTIMKSILSNSFQLFNKSKNDGNSHRKSLLTKSKKWNHHSLFSRNIFAKSLNSFILNHQTKCTNLQTSMKTILSNSFRLFNKRKTDRNALRYAPKQSSSLLLAKFKKWSDPFFNDPDKLVWAIIGINCAIYLLWNYAFLQGRSNGNNPLLNWMLKHFTTNSQRLSYWWAMILSNFSHMNFWHLLTNMYMLHQFSPYIIQVLGARQFFGFYIASCLSSSLFSIFSQLSLNRPANSLGASGCVTGNYVS
jgi:membrane associated rhomboid family serine protease